MKTPYPSMKRASKLVQRNLVVYRHTWMIIFSGFFEPLFYLVAVGFGVGQFIDTVSFGGREISYTAFVAPGMLAASTLNGAITDGFFNPFFKLTYQKTYDGIIATPMNVPDIALGEMLWAQMRGSLYVVGFLALMLVLGLTKSPWAILALPGGILGAGAMSAGAMVLTSVAKEITAIDKVMNLIFFPLFLFSGTFFPVTLYPGWLQPIVQLTPLYHVSSMLRSFTTGIIGPGVLLNAGYLAVMFVICTTVAMRRLGKRLVY